MITYPGGYLSRPAMQENWTHTQVFLISTFTQYISARTCRCNSLLLITIYIFVDNILVFIHLRIKLLWHLYICIQTLFYKYSYTYMYLYINNILILIYLHVNNSQVIVYFSYEQYLSMCTRLYWFGPARLSICYDFGWL